MYCKAKRDMIVHGVIISLKLFANLGASVIVCIEQYLERSYSYETDIGNLADLNFFASCTHCGVRKVVTEGMASHLPSS